MAVAAATGLLAVAREVHRVERAATSDTGERLVLRRWRQLREVVPLPCRSMHARLRAHALRELACVVEECRTSLGVKVADRLLSGARLARLASPHKSPAHAGP